MNSSEAFQHLFLYFVCREESYTHYTPEKELLLFDLIDKGPAGILEYAGCRLQVAGCRLQVAGYFAGCRFILKTRS